MLDVISGRMAFFEVFYAISYDYNQAYGLFTPVQGIQKEKVLQTTFKSGPLRIVISGEKHGVPISRVRNSPHFRYFSAHF